MKPTLLPLCCLLYPTLLQAQPNAWINELHYDNAGADTSEFVEVVIENVEAFTLSEFALVLYNGNGGASYSTLALTGPPDATENGFSVYAVDTPGIQNGAPDGIALCYEGSLVSSGSVGQFLSYEGSFTATDGCASGLTSTDLGVEEGGSTAIGESLQLEGTSANYAAFSWTGPATASPGAVNAGQTLDAEADQTTTLAFQTIASTANEGDGAVALPVVLTTSDGAPLEATVQGTVAFDAAQSSGSADDLTGSTSSSVTFLTGSASGTVVNAEFTLADDDIPEGTEKLVFALTSAGADTADNIGDDTYTLSVEDNEPVVRFAHSGATVGEADGSTTLTVEINRAPDPGNDVTVDVAIDVASSTGDAADVDDYTTQTVSFSDSGTLSEDITITLTNDSEQEGTETVVFVLQNVNANGAIGMPARFDLTIQDDDVVSTAAPGDLILTEFMANPAATSDSEGEYLELYNTTGQAINIDGFILRDDDTDSTLLDSGGSLFVPARGFVTLAISASPGFAPDYVYSGFLLSNGDDELVLTTPSGTEIARLNYTDGDPFGAGVAAELIDINSPVDGVSQEGGYQAATMDLGNGDLGSPGAFGTTIPVELTAFEARADGQAAVLTWHTASEANNAGFEVQQEAEGSFQRIAFVEGAGTTTEPQQYRYRTDNLSAGQHRFRLKQVDLDGHFTYSGAMEVHIRLTETFTLSTAHPNPFYAETTFTLAVGEAQEVTVAVYDVLGRHVATIFDGRLDAHRAQTLRFVAKDNLPSGIYLCRVSGGHFTAAQRMVLVR